MRLPLVVRVINRLDGCAVIGAFALAARGYVRQTGDVDLMTADTKALDERTWLELRADGAAVEVRKGDFDDPLGGVIRIQEGESSVDVVVSKTRWQKAIIDRSEEMDVGANRLHVVRTADLILLKLFAGGYGDLHDIHRLLEAGAGEQLIEEVGRSLGGLPEETQQLWRRFLEDRDRF